PPHVALPPLCPPHLPFFLSLSRPPPTSTLFPYTTLFRSVSKLSRPPRKLRQTRSLRRQRPSRHRLRQLRLRHQLVRSQPSKLPRVRRLPLRQRKNRSARFPGQELVSCSSSA